MKNPKNEITLRSSTAEYLTYIASVGDDESRVEIRYEDEKTHTINYHIKKTIADSELEKNSVIRNYRITADDGKSYNAKHYSLEMFIAVGFKVN